MVSLEMPSTTSNDPTRVSATSTKTTSSSYGGSGIKKRTSKSSRSIQPDKTKEMDDDVEHRPRTAEGGSDNAGSVSTSAKSGKNSRWIMLALASGCCAAFNGVFAKLTTGDRTSSIAQGLARFLHLSAFETIIELIVRCIFFGLNLAFNGVMWTLFTQALAKGNSTTQVSIMNTSSNFVITAVLGFAIFSESLPPLWWLGAAMLVAGNVIIGQKDESAKNETPLDDDASLASLPHASPTDNGLGSYRDAPESNERSAVAPEKKDGEDEDILDLGEIGAEETRA